jgi:hypothetical protein
MQSLVFRLQASVLYGFRRYINPLEMAWTASRTRCINSPVHGNTGYQLPCCPNHGDETAGWTENKCK